MKNKQEVIDIFNEVYRYPGGIDLAVPHDVVTTDEHVSWMAEMLYDRNAPPVAGEFPEAKFEQLLLDKDVWSNRGLLMQFRLIWEGQDHIAGAGKKVGTGTPEQERQDAMNKAASRGLAKLSVKGTCPTCGGSGKCCYFRSRSKPCSKPAQRQVGCLYCPHYDPCPTCKGTGEGKKKYCLRCGVLCADESVVMCINGQAHRWTDERSGSDRRELRHTK